MEWLSNPSVTPLVNLATFAGVLLTLVALGITLHNVIRARNKVTAVEKATRETLNAVRQFDTLLAITAAVEMMEELKRIHREDRWPTALERYPIVLRQVDLTRDAGPDLSDEDQTALQRIGDGLRMMERVVERDRARQTDEANAESFNSMLSEHVRTLHSLQIRMKLRIE